MFTGIIKETGLIKSIKKKAGLWQIGVSVNKLFSDIDKGDSVSVNGVCLTAVDKKQNLVFFDVVKTTLETTNLKRLRISSLVNLEPALRAGDKISGHFVLGHVDCELNIKSISNKGEYFSMAAGYDRKFSSYLVDKGSIAIDGISLTIQELRSSFFAVSIIPYTFEHTNLKTKHAGEWVNAEFDYLLKRR
ncbi:MAG: hypothetical protein B1H08_06545 [Candidatus Omnitrophica bacterium 4484_171]|nr:MAG: hypothetical protein B1H08_06545 [Candidatus Omnitrophica bacterium 4484_171]